MLNKIHLLLLWRFLRLQHMQRIVVELIHIFFVGDDSDNFAWFTGGNGAEGGGIVTFGAPGDVVDICKLFARLSELFQFKMCWLRTA